MADRAPTTEAPPTSTTRSTRSSTALVELMRTADAAGRAGGAARAPPAARVPGRRLPVAHPAAAHDHGGRRLPQPPAGASARTRCGRGRGQRARRGRAAAGAAGLAASCRSGSSRCPTTGRRGLRKPSIPPTVGVRADFHAPLFDRARRRCTRAGARCRSARRGRSCPPSQPGPPRARSTWRRRSPRSGGRWRSSRGRCSSTPPSTPSSWRGSETPATSPFVLAARELDGGTTVPEASWVAKRASATRRGGRSAGADCGYLEVAPILDAAGWIPARRRWWRRSRWRSAGRSSRFVNLTGLVAGETTLGDELRLLYTPAAIARSAFATVEAFVWDGAAFAAPS